MLINHEVAENDIISTAHLFCMLNARQNDVIIIANANILMIQYGQNTIDCLALIQVIANDENVRKILASGSITFCNKLRVSLWCSRDDADHFFALISFASSARPLSKILQINTIAMTNRTSNQLHVVAFDTFRANSVIARAPRVSIGLFCIFLSSKAAF
jgi:hypothetical protein